MGLRNSRFFWIKRRKMLDKGNFTSDFSLESSMSTPSSSLCKLICGEREEERAVSVLEQGEQEDSEEIRRLRRGREVMRMCLEREAEEQRVEESERERKEAVEEVERVSGDGDNDEERESYEMEKLGINKCILYNGKSYYNCLFYVPECELVMVHYLTLYRLRLDSLSQKNFEKWCNKIGHFETLKSYSALVNIYDDMKKKHFKDSFIINRIISRQNVYFKITDSFGEESKRLRAVIIIGERRAVIQNVIDSYCFAIKGKVAFVIKSLDDYKKHVNSAVRMKPVKWNLSKSFLSNNCRILKHRVTIASGRKVYSTTDTCSNTFNVHNIPQNSLDEFSSATKHFPICPKLPVEESYKNCSSFQKKQCDVEDVCYNNPIYCDGGTYNLVAIIADSTYAYVLCRNCDMNGDNYDNMDLSLINEDDLITSEYGVNQSNSYHRITALKKILRAEMLECCNKRFYGLALSKIPLGELYVVRCHITKDVLHKEKLLNEILTRHKVCGKVINKDFHLNSNIQGDLVVHLHGNENYVRNCCLDLTRRGLATNLQVIHPYSTIRT